MAPLAPLSPVPRIASTCCLPFSCRPTRSIHRTRPISPALPVPLNALPGLTTRAMATSTPKPAPLYAFDLPRDLVSRLEPCDALTPRIKSSNTATPSLAGPGPNAASSTGAGRSCSTCPAAPTFPSPRDQRLHYQSDWHRFNSVLLARGHAQHRLEAGPFEAALDRLDMMDEQEEDGTDDEWDDRSGWDPVARLIRSLGLESSPGQSTEITEAALSASSDEDPDADGGLIDNEAAHLWFVPGANNAPAHDQASNPPAWEGTQVGVHRALFEDLTEQSNPMDYALFMVRNMHVGQILRHPPGSIAAKTDPRLAPSTPGAQFRGKRLQGGVQDVGKKAQFAILDGHGFIPGLRLTVQEEDQAGTQSDSSTSYSTASSSESASEAEADQATVDTVFVEPKSGPTLPADPPMRLWTVIMMGGGHFAATVLMLNPYVTVTRSKKRGERHERSLVVLAHRTFHRYTTRRKQGGGQAAQDASGKFAKSAGAQLRRAGEDALKREIRELLDLPGWRALLARSERIWFRAPMRAAKDVLWSWDSVSASQASPLDAARVEGRLANLPIPTRRPTIEECVRCFFELTRVRTAHYSPEQLAEMQKVREQTASEAEVRATRRKLAAQARGSKAAPASTVRKVKAELSAEEKARRSRWERFMEMVSKRKEGAAMGFLAKHEWDTLEPPADEKTDAGLGPKGKDGKKATAEPTVNSPLPSWWVEQQVKAATKPHTLIPVTLLQLAAENDLPNLVENLLVEHRADPTLPVRDTGEQPDSNKSGAPSEAPADSTPGEQPEASHQSHRTAYDLAASKAVKEVFLQMQSAQPTWWDWSGTGPGGARVRPLSAESKSDQATGQLRPEAAKGRRNAMRDKAKARAATSAALAAAAAAADGEEEGEEEPVSTPALTARQAAEAQPSSTRANRLGGPGPGAPRALRQQLEDTSISPAMRARIEREKRAKAAEERIRRLQGK